MATSTELFDAIRHGDMEAVSRILAADPLLAKTRNGDGATTVQWAVYCRHREMADTLLAERDPDFFEACALGRYERAAELLERDPSLASAFSGDGFTALGLAAFFGWADIARLLLDCGADPNQSSRNQIRVAPLHSAVAAGSLEIVDLLLARGAAPDPVEFLGFTPLASAAGHGSREMVLHILAHGADPRHRTSDGQTPADIARSRGHEALAEELEKMAGS